MPNRARGRWLIVNLLMIPVHRTDLAKAEEMSDPKASVVAEDEQITFFSTIALPTQNGYSIPVHGWIYEPTDNRLIRSRLSAALRIKRDLTRAERDRFEKTFRWFTADSERGKRIAIDIVGKTIVSGPSDGGGHFHAAVSLSKKEVAQHSIDGWVSFSAKLGSDDTRSFVGRCQIVEPEQWLVISDIDDTVKITQVGSKRRVLANTFVNELRAVDGMSKRYQQWSTQGARFHFVSSSPYQLYPTLKAFFTRKKFPDASYTLQPVRMSIGSLQSVFADPFERKVAAISKIIKAYSVPIVLVGDSGERDPEVYGEIARLFPDRVKCILIR